MKKFNLVNNISGWIIFAIAAVVYIITVEPTASFWDCGEFISCAFKLQISHPPGYPMFAMLGRIATLFAGGNVQNVPMTMNILSALCSAFTILFLFWTITHLAYKVIGRKTDYSTSEIITIIGCGVVGALTFTFSDSFWFSSEEAVVFSPSSLFTASIFWAILKWENDADEKYANRWLILIAYLMGLSIGIHLLNLLTIPALGLVYYFRKYPVSRNGIIITLIISFAVLIFVMFGIIQGTFVIASWFELLFVNGFGLPFNSGFIFFIILLIGLIIWSIWYTSKMNKVLWNTIILCLTVILLGYSSYTMTIIRSNANTPLNESNPSNLFNFLSYLSREQYGDRPLLYGQYYNAPIRDMKDGKAIYARKDGKYKEISHKPEYVYDPQFCTLFPRMYSSEGSHVSGYKQWANIKGIPVETTNQHGEAESVNKPTWGENIKFFWKYQVGWMYFRYFMWNFAGRQNDIQGLFKSDNLRGNWISGVNFIDEIRLGSQNKIPETISGMKFKHNKARNVYFFFPLLLGLAGLFFHYKQDRKNFWVVMVLFFMTGLAIVLYLNQKPFEPRERDYSYVGSYYAFSIWIGLGVLGLLSWVGKKIKGIPTKISIIVICLLLVPGLMAHENWDDHDRSRRYTSTDSAYDYLNSCAPNAVIFTMGDNDTFPLWCAQEVLGIRTDVRVVNLSYLSGDWYIDQMRYKINDSEPLNFSLSSDKYSTGTRDILYIVDAVKGQYADLKDVMDFVGSDNPKTKSLPNSMEHIDYIPANKLSLKVNAQKALMTKTVTPQFADSIVPEMKWDLGKRRAIYKNDMMVLDFIANNDWKRPVYFAITVPDENYLGLEKYFRLDGLAYRIIPVEASNREGQIGSIDTQLLYDNLMNKFKWGNAADTRVYIDENNVRMLSNFRNNFARLAEVLINENKIDQAVKALDKCFEVLPINQIPLNYWALPLIEQYYRAKQFSKANDLTSQLFKNLNEEAQYYTQLKNRSSFDIDQEKRMCLYTMNQLGQMTTTYGQNDLSRQIKMAFQGYVGELAIEK